MKIVIDEQRKAAEKNPFGVGTKSYLDTLSGMVPCVVVGVEPGTWYGFSVGGERAIRIRLTKTVGAYKVGEIIDCHAGNVVPKPQRILRGSSYRVNTSYCFKGEQNAN